jgi:hypothetical protein
MNPILLLQDRNKPVVMSKEKKKSSVQLAEDVPSSCDAFIVLVTLNPHFNYTTKEQIERWSKDIQNYGMANQQQQQYAHFIMTNS